MAQVLKTCERKLSEVRILYPPPMLRKYLPYLLSLLLIFCVGLWLTENFSQSIRFTDEDGHMVGGALFLHGLIPYRDFSSNHQPILYFFSTLIHRLFSLNSIFLLVKRHREFIFLYSLIWDAIFLVYLRRVGLIFILIFESSKILLLGNQYLGETLAAYPFVMLLILTAKVYFSKTTLSLKELGLAGISSFIAMFSLLPLWPALAFLNVMLIVKNRKNWQGICLLVGVEVILAIIVFMFIPFGDYFRETFVNNIKYFFPSITNTTKISFMPIFVLIPSFFTHDPNQIERILIPIVFLIALIAIDAYKSKKIWVWTLLFIAVLISNTRVSTFHDNLLYGGFHALPWLYGMLVLPAIFLNGTKQKKLFYTGLFLAVISLLSVVVYPNNLLTRKNDIHNESYINYSEATTYGQAIEAMKNDKDRSIFYETDSLGFWVSGTRLPTHMLDYYSWMFTVPALKSEFIKVMDTNPPEFIVYINSVSIAKATTRTETFGQILDTKLQSEYVRVKYQGKPSKLFILKSRAKQITQAQKDGLSYLEFTIPGS